MPKPPPPPQFNLSFSGLVSIIVVILAGWLAITSFYQVPTDSEAVVLRFGKFAGMKDRGFHFKLPFGIDEVEIEQTRRQKKLEFGFGTAGNTNAYQYAESATEQAEEKNMVTGDLNAVLVEWVVQYRIDNLQNYVFNVREPESTLRDASESVMREIIGDRTVDEVITVGRAEIESETLVKLQELVSSYEMGLKIDQIQLKDVDPPKEVQPSFNDVNSAQQEREKTINEARRDYDSAIPRAKGEAEKSISEAEAYKKQRVNEAEGDAARFNSVFAEYQKAPEVTKRRLYLETLSDVIPNLGNKVIIDEETSQLLPLLNLQNEAK